MINNNIKLYLPVIRLTFVIKLKNDEIILEKEFK